MAWFGSEVALSVSYSSTPCLSYGVDCLDFYIIWNFYIIWLRMWWKMRRIAHTPFPINVRKRAGMLLKHYRFLICSQVQHRRAFFLHIKKKQPQSFHKHFRNIKWGGEGGEGCYHLSLWKHYVCRYQERRTHWSVNTLGHQESMTHLSIDSYLPLENSW